MGQAPVGLRAPESKVLVAPRLQEVVRFFPLPPVVLSLALGEVSQVLLASQNVKPERALAAGFAFKFQGLDAKLSGVEGAKVIKPILV